MKARHSTNIEIMKKNEVHTSRSIDGSLRRPNLGILLGLSFMKYCPSTTTGSKINSSVKNTRMKQTVEIVTDIGLLCNSVWSSIINGLISTAKCGQSGSSRVTVVDIFGFRCLQLSIYCLSAVCDGRRSRFVDSTCPIRTVYIYTHTHTISINISETHRHLQKNKVHRRQVTC